MKKTYKSPEIYVWVFNTDELMIGALEMSDPKINGSSESKSDMLFDNNDDAPEQFHSSIWYEYE